MHREVEFECSSYLDKEYDILMVYNNNINNNNHNDYNNDHNRLKML